MKLITWNIQWARGIDGIVDPARIIAHARSMADFDVLCLQEVADNFADLAGNDDSNQFATFAALLPGFTAIEGIALDIPGEAGRRKRFGNMILSRYPVDMIQRSLLPWEADKTHNMPRLLLEATLLAPFGPVRMMTTHLEYSSPLLRAAQVEGIRDIHRLAVARHHRQRSDGPGTYRAGPTTTSAILTGDFNMKPDDPLKHRISEEIATGVPALLDLWLETRKDVPHPPSFCVFEQLYGPPHACDFVFATPDLVSRTNSISYDTTTQVSDHQPVLVEFSLD